jgi:methyl-accepting chemotaxis protein
MENVSVFAPHNPSQPRQVVEPIGKTQRLRQSRIRKRLIVENLVRLILTALVWLVTNQMLGSSLAPYRLRFALVLTFLLILPGFVLKWLNWREANHAIQEMWAFGQLNYGQVSGLLATRRVIESELSEAVPFLNLLHQQIGGTLRESETEVVEAIDQLSELHRQASEQQAKIAGSIRSGRALQESTDRRARVSHETIASLRSALNQHRSEIISNLERIERLADEMRSLSPLTRVITSIAQQTTLLALNAEIEAASAGRAGRGFAVVACEVRKLAVHTTQTAADMVSRIHTACHRADQDMQQARLSLEKHDASIGVQQLMGDLEAMQEDFSRNSHLLLEVITGVEKTYTESVARLGSALGHIQFQDVMRQRLEHVQDALLQMREHMMSLAHLAHDPRWDGTLSRTFSGMVDAQRGLYKMASQADTHLAVTGVRATNGASGPPVELF